MRIWEKVWKENKYPRFLSFIFMEKDGEWLGVAALGRREQRHQNGFWDVRQKEDGGRDVRATSAEPSEMKGGQSGQKPAAASAGGSGVVGKQQHGTGRQQTQGKFLLRYFIWQSLDPSASASNPGPTKAPEKTNHNKCVCVKFISKQSRVASSVPVFISHQKPCIRFTLTPGTPTASFLLGSPSNLPAGPGFLPEGFLPEGNQQAISSICKCTS